MCACRTYLLPLKSCEHILRVDRSGTYKSFNNDVAEKSTRKLEKELETNEIEFRRGSAGGGNQARQPYIKNQEAFKNYNPSIELPVADHIHFFGMYIGNFPELTKKEIDWLLKVINNV